MKKFLHSSDGASRGAALIIVLAVVLAVTTFNAERVRAATDTCVSVSNAVPVAAGRFYRVDDMLDPVSGALCGLANNYAFRLRVTSVDSGGGVIAVTIVPGIGYSNPPSNPVSFAGSATGSGFTANCTFN